ncbi:MAG: DNA alkylation repair protein [candidate division WOR-3 bacterium]|nr:MAG: DNA alkylation repair protein [candidate division WOR-3 bacterium]
MITRAAIVRELKKHVDETYRKGAESYFKEGISLYGVRANIVRRVAADAFRKIKKENKKEIFRLCEDLLRSRYSEEKAIAFDWAHRLQKKYAPGDFRLFESWLRKYVSNWGACDDFCRHAFGVFVHEFPEFLPDVLAWTRSRNRWLRRGAAVIMIHSLRKGKHLDFAFNIADALMSDQDYLVQNGYGWMLKDASIIFPSQVLNYVVNHKKEMPRRALRYAIERFTPEQKRKAMGST